MIWCNPQDSRKGFDILCLATNDAWLANIFGQNVWNKTPQDPKNLKRQDLTKMSRF